MIVVGLSNSKVLAKMVAGKLNVDHNDLLLRNSDDGLHVKFNSNLKNKKVVLVQSLFPNADNALFEVMYAASAARDLGAKEVIYVAPYLAFFREDSRNVKGECVQLNSVADLLNRNVDAVVSVEPHLHKHSLISNLFSIPFYSLECNELLRKYVKNNFSGCKVLGYGDRAWKLAKHIDKNAALYDKGESAECEDDVLIVDDIIMTGKSMLGNIKNLKANRINIMAVHGLFNDDCYKNLRENADRVISCNTVWHESNKIDVSGLIAGRLMEL